MVSSEESPDNKVTSEEFLERQRPDDINHTAQHIHDIEVKALQSQEGVTPSIIAGNPKEDPGARILQLDKEGSVSSIIPGKVSRTPSNGSHSVHSAPEGRTPSAIREKVSEDGYLWRKYGQKLVKGNEFVRSYYRCTHPNCQVKKQLECSHKGQIADVIYFGQHEHSKPQISVPVAVGFALSIVEGRSDKPELTGTEKSEGSQQVELPNTAQISITTTNEDVRSLPSESHRIKDEVDGDDPRSKRQKKGNRSTDPTTPLDKLHGESRSVVQTFSEVDIVNDGYRWRKYGQKLVKGNPNPRSYYRCSSPGCPVKKHVERASHNSKLVVTSYEGQHDHEMPALRTVTHNPAGLNSNAIQSSESSAKAREGSAVFPDTIAYNESSSHGKLKEQLTVESSEVKEGDSSHQSKPNEELPKGSDVADMDMVGIAGSVSEDNPDEQQDSKPRSESKVNSTASCIQTIAPCTEVKENEHHIHKSESIQS